MVLPQTEYTLITHHAMTQKLFGGLDILPNKGTTKTNNNESDLKTTTETTNNEADGKTTTETTNNEADRKTTTKTNNNESDLKTTTETHQVLHDWAQRW